MYFKEKVRQGGLKCIAINKDGYLLIKGFLHGHTGKPYNLTYGVRSSHKDCLWIHPRHVKIYQKGSNTLFNIDDL